MRPGRKLQSSGGGNSSWSSQGGWDNEAKENEPRNSVSRSQHAAVKQADGPSPVAAGMKSKSGEASFGSGQRQTQAAKYKALQGSNIFGGESDAANLQDATAKLQQVQVADGPPAGSAGQFRSADPGSRDISDTKKRALYQTNVFVNTAEAPSAAAEVQPVKEVPAEPAGSAGHFRSAEPGNREISDFKKKALYSTHVFGVEDNGPTAAPQVDTLSFSRIVGDIHH
ncbi:hypothetical protein WJX72_003571 [[Myrmecia] bisecta]|uniref:Uncharacterized protein n=1 Tax=[Myrmecia] bisecta TaxID=41462 RepID=A0AAW1QPS0_9CHLO